LCSARHWRQLRDAPFAALDEKEEDDAMYTASWGCACCVRFVIARDSTKHPPAYVSSHCGTCPLVGDQVKNVGCRNGSLYDAAAEALRDYLGVRSPENRKEWRRAANAMAQKLAELAKVAKVAKVAKE